MHLSLSNPFHCTSSNIPPFYYSRRYKVPAVTVMCPRTSYSVFWYVTCSFLNTPKKRIVDLDLGTVMAKRFAYTIWCNVSLVLDSKYLELLHENVGAHHRVKTTSIIAPLWHIFKKNHRQSLQHVLVLKYHSCCAIVKFTITKN